MYPCFFFTLFFSLYPKKTFFFFFFFFFFLLLWIFSWLLRDVRCPIRNRIALPASSRNRHKQLQWKYIPEDNSKHLSSVPVWRTYKSMNHREISDTLATISWAPHQCCFFFLSFPFFLSYLFIQSCVIANNWPGETVTNVFYFFFSRKKEYREMRFRGNEIVI